MRAFALKQEYALDGPNPLCGGQIALPPEGRTLDVMGRIKAHDDGVILVSDPIEGEALANYPALKELSGTEFNDALAARQPKVVTADSSKADLVERAEALGLPTTGTKDELMQRIADHAQGEND